jgi:hypothetical protein
MYQLAAVASLCALLLVYRGIHDSVAVATQ